MNAFGDDHSIENEPHLSNRSFEIDPSELAARKRIRSDSNRETLDDWVDHTVWDEPGLSAKLSGKAPENALTYSEWLAYRIQETHYVKTWFVTILVALAAGPLAVLTALYEGNSGGFHLVMLTIFGPLVEETGKVAIAMWVVEKRPFLLSSRFQIFLCALSGGFFFSVIENMLYLYVYVPNPPAELVFWRWTVCVGLHCGCSMIAGIGLQNVWSDSMHNLKRPDILIAAPYLMTAIVIHGIYNGSVVLLEMGGLIF